MKLTARQKRLLDELLTEYLIQKRKLVTYKNKTAGPHSGDALTARVQLMDARVLHNKVIKEQPVNE